MEINESIAVSYSNKKFAKKYFDSEKVVWGNLALIYLALIWCLR